MNRRLALATLGLLALLVLAGCADPAGSLRMTAATDGELADRTTVDVGENDVYPALRRDEVLEGAIRNGSVTVAALREPVDADRPVRYQGRYYTVSRTARTAADGYTVSIGVDYNASESPEEVVALDELPADTRRRLQPYLDHRPRDLAPGIDAEFPVAIAASDASNSTIIDRAGTEFVVSTGDRTYRLAVRQPRERRIHVYRYEATLRAESQAEYAAWLRDEYAVSFADLTDGERSILESAAGDEYYAENDEDAAFASLADRFDRHRAIYRSDGSGTWLVRYDGTLYLAELYAGAFLEDTRTATTRTPKVTPH